MNSHYRRISKHLVLVLSTCIYCISARGPLNGWENIEFQNIAFAQRYLNSKLCKQK